MKKTLSLLILLTIAFLGLQGTALAAGHGKGSGICLKSKFFKKYNMMMEHRKELDLSDDQLQAIKNIKMTVKRAKAEMKGTAAVVSIDVYNEIYLGDNNSDTVNGLIEKKIDVKRNFMQAVTKGLQDYKSLLSDDQMKKLKDIWYDEKYSEDKGGHGSCEKCGHGKSKCHKG